MTTLDWILIGVGVVVALFFGFALVIYILSRREDKKIEEVDYGEYRDRAVDQAQAATYTPYDDA